MRDHAQEESLHQVNRLIDEILINSKDPTNARHKCQQYLSACSTSDAPGQDCVDGHPIDKRFESALLGCSLDDQKRIKQRLLSLSKYLGKKSVTDWILETSIDAKLSQKVDKNLKISRQVC